MNLDAPAPQAERQRQVRRSLLYRLAVSTNVQVLLAAMVAATLGVAAPGVATAMQPLTDVFVSLIKLVIAPIVFLVVVTGIVTAGGMRTVGRVAIKALLYFEAVTTVAMLIGFLAVNLLRPGAGVAPPAGGATGNITSYLGAAGSHGAAKYLVAELIPSNAVNAFATGNLVQVLVFAVIFALALVTLPESARAPIVAGCQSLATAFFRMITIIVRLAPIGTFGAVAYTVGKFGPETLTALMKLVGTSLVALVVFVVVVLGAVTRMIGVSLWRLLRGLRRELYIVLGTSSSESVLPQLMQRLEEFGCARSVVGLVVPTGYSFNLDGVAVVAPVCVVFIGQVYGVHLGLATQLGLFLMILVLSKGTAGVTGSAFVTLASVVATAQVVPVAGLALVLAVDRFLSLARAVVNVTGNAVASVAVARWEPNGLDPELIDQTIGSRRHPRPETG